MNQLLRVLNSKKNLNENDLEVVINNLTINELNKQDYNPSNDNFKYLIEFALNLIVLNFFITCRYISNILACWCFDFFGICLLH